MSEVKRSTVYIVFDSVVQVELITYRIVFTETVHREDGPAWLLGDKKYWYLNGIEQRTP